MEQESTLLKVIPSSGLFRRAKREYKVPQSKPETQRAILIGSLAPGHSEIEGDLRCNETLAMRSALEAVGARYAESDSLIRVQGVALGRGLSEVPIIDCGGSALVARVFAVLGLLVRSPLIVTGDETLRRREMRPLFEALNDRSGALRYLGDAYRLPILVSGNGLRGGVYELPGDVSSQFITALLVGAPYADTPVTIHVTGSILSASYIRQTIAAMQRAGAIVEHDDSLRHLRVSVGEYCAFRTRIGSDYTAASYFLAAAALAQGTTVLHGLSRESLQGERAILDILCELGLSCDFDSHSETLTVENRRESLIGNYEFDVSDCPNILPTLAAIGSYVEGVFRVRGGSITRLHKSPRVESMVTELRKVGVDIVPIFSNGIVDGFEIHGRPTYAGGTILSSHRDHRVFMSLVVASLRMRQPNLIAGFTDIEQHSPGILGQLESTGAVLERHGKGAEDDRSVRWDQRL